MKLIFRPNAMETKFFAMANLVGSGSVVLLENLDINRKYVSDVVVLQAYQVGHASAAAYGIWGRYKLELPVLGKSSLSLNVRLKLGKV